MLGGTEGDWVSPPKGCCELLSTVTSWITSLGSRLGRSLGEPCGQWTHTEPRRALPSGFLTLLQCFLLGEAFVLTFRCSDAASHCKQRSFNCKLKLLLQEKSSHCKPKRRPLYAKRFTKNSLKQRSSLNYNQEASNGKQKRKLHPFLFLWSILKAYCRGCLFLKRFLQKKFCR